MSQCVSINDRSVNPQQLSVVQSFPPDILETILLFVGIPIEISRLGALCHSFWSAAKASHVWEKLATIRYGKTIANASIDLYDGDWRRLMIDDNRLGALPALTSRVVCMYAHNRIDRFYCCIVQCVKFDRADEEILVYIDVRGEDDLRHPMESSLALRNAMGLVQVRPSRRMEPVVNSRPLRFIEDQPSTDRHNKGCLVFPAQHQPGVYTFSYANPTQQNYTDYVPVTLFEIPEGPNELERAFRNGTEHVRHSSHDSAFAQDTPEIELARWNETVPPELMNESLSRQYRRRPWYREI